MIYSIVETNQGKEDFVVHRFGCSHTIRTIRATITADSAPDAAREFMEMHYTDLDRELGFGTYRIMPCST